MTAPADGQVEAFARTAPRARLVSVGKAMRPLPKGGAEAGPVTDGPALPRSTTVEDAAPRVLASDAPTLVADEAGRPVGLIAREDVIAVLFPGGVGR